MFCFPAASQQRIQPARMHSCPSSVLFGADKVAPAAMALSQQPGSIMLTLSKGQTPFLSWFLLLSWDVGDSFCFM